MRDLGKGHGASVSGGSEANGVGGRMGRAVGFTLSSPTSEGREGFGTRQKPGFAVQIHRAGAAANYSFFNNRVYYLPLMVVQGVEVKPIQLPEAFGLPAIFMTRETFAGEMQPLHL